jgi:muramoyltetrapeptide carboxypeptidase
MKRKHFLSSLISAGVSLPAITAGLNEKNDTGNILTIPPYLRPGDTIGITSPAGYITLEEIQPAILQMEGWGFKIKTGDTIGKKDFTFGGTDEERREDFQQMLDNPKIKAIMCARGGYGVVRIIDKLNWEKFKTKPKWIIGFSDITVFHAHISRNFGVASIHSKMCNSFPDDWDTAEPIQIETIESIHKTLRGVKMKYSAVPNMNNKQGSGEGILVGGNLKLMETLAGTASDLKTDNKILFVEDTGEYMYNIDRMFWNLKRTGKLTKLAGLIIGGFKVKKDDDTEDFGKTLEQVVLEKVKNYKYPVCFDFPVGHQRNNFAYKHGAGHHLSVKADTVTLTEIRLLKFHHT